MKRLTSIILALIMLISSAAFSTTAYAVEYVTVYLNDKLIDFPSTDARPHIKDNRTYVPVRKTCDALGINIDWNSKTETMTLTRDGITIAHTMRSKIVYVNGEVVQFDTPSINDKNRILMPIRMIAESIGATVTWDDPTRSVHIATSAKAGNDLSKAVVNSVTASKTAVAKDTEITITAVCSKETDCVKFVRTNDNSEIGALSKYTENADGTRSFVTEYKCENNTNADAIFTIQAIPGIKKNYSDAMSASKSVSFMVSSEKTETTTEDEKTDDGDYKSDYMISCKLTNDEIKTDDYAKFKIKTKSKVKKVRLTTNANGKDAVISDYDEDDDGNRTFNGKLEMTKEGKWKVYVTLYVSGDYEDVSETYNVTVDDDFRENSGSDELEILEMWTANDYAYKGYDTTLFVKTSTDVDYLELLTEDQDEGDGQRTHSTADKRKNYYYWEFTFTVKHTGDMRFKLLAYDEDGESVSDTFSLEGRSVSKSEPAVLSIDQRTSSLIEGEEAKFNITTTGCVDRIRITRGTSRTVYDEKVSPSSSIDETHTIEFKVDDINEDYYVTAYNSDNFDRVKFNLIGDVEEEIKIKDVDVEDDTVDEDEDVKLTVTTSNSAYRIWVEDSREKQVSKVYKSPDDEDGDDLIWEIEFTPLEDGRQTFTVKAQDENKKDDTWDFKVTVR